LFGGVVAQFNPGALLAQPPRLALLVARRFYPPHPATMPHITTQKRLYIFVSYYIFNKKQKYAVGLCQKTLSVAMLWRL
jgi:hypothetical protein